MKYLSHILIACLLLTFSSCGNEAGVPEDTKHTEAEAKTLIDELHTRLKNGEDFATLAKEYTEDPGSKESGGQYEHVARGMMVPEFDKVTFELGLNEISEPFLTEFGYHIVTVTAIRENERDVRHILIQVNK